MLPVISFLFGCFILTFSADNFLKSSVVIAKRFNFSELIIGVVLVGFGTSFAEVIVSAVAAWHGQSQMAVGNVLGSNVANIGLVIGITAMIVPLHINSQFIKREFPILLVVTAIVGGLLWGHYLSRWDGLILLGLLAIHLFFLFKQGSSDPALAEEATDDVLHTSGMPYKRALLMWPVGLFLLFISSELIVFGATAIAHWLHLSEYLIGLTVVALGTSLPELATLVLSAVKEQHDVAIGTILGSNIFNLLAVLAVPALIHPTQLPASFNRVDYPVLLGFTLLFYLFAVFPKQVVRRFSRLEGGLLIIAYMAYVIFMYIQ
jgi:cation:H+ antiporter